MKTVNVRRLTLCLLLELGLTSALTQATAQSIDTVAEKCLEEQTATLCVQPVRPDRSFKTLVLEYIDTQATSIGHTLSRFTYREIREFTTDIEGSAVILVHNQTNNSERQTKNPILTPDYQEFFAEALTSSMLRLQGHEAANAIGAAATAEVVSWGTAIDLADTVLVQPSLSIINKESDWKVANVSGDFAQFSYVMPSWRMNFGAINIPKSSLFSREFLVRCNRRNQCPDGIPLRKLPSNDSPLVAHVQRGDVVTSVGATNQFLEVSSEEGRGFMNIYHAELTPSVVHINEDRFIARESPSKDSVRVFKGSVNDTFDVLALAKDKSDPKDEHIRKNWYKISVSGIEGWFQNQREFYGATQPKNLVNAGLYRLFAKQPDTAASLFDRYLALTAETAPSDTKAISYQLLAFAVLSGTSSKENTADAAEQALLHLNAAQALLPFNPKPIFLKGLVLLSLGKTEDGIEAIRLALELNPQDTTFAENMTSEICFSEPTQIAGAEIVECIKIGQLLTTVSETRSKKYEPEL